MYAIIIKFNFNLKIKIKFTQNNICLVCLPTGKTTLILVEFTYYSQVVKFKSYQWKLYYKKIHEISSIYT